MKKPWPRDAIIIVAARAGKERRKGMVGPTEGKCRDCATPVVYDIASYDHIRERVPDDTRPIEPLCHLCYAMYDTSRAKVIDRTAIDDHSKDSLISPRVENCKTPAPNSVQMPCSVCKHKVWLSPASQKIVAGGATVFCTQCT